MQLKADLHVHTTYSKDSVITPKDLVFYAKKRGLDAVAVTDHDRVDGALKIAKELEESKLQAAANTLISLARSGNQYLNEKEPWNLLKTDKEKAATVLYVMGQVVKALAVVSAPFVPGTAEQIWQTLNLKGSANSCRWQDALSPLKAGHKIGKAKPLFKKIDADEKSLDETLAQVRERMKADLKCN